MFLDLGKKFGQSGSSALKWDMSFVYIFEILPSSRWKLVSNWIRNIFCCWFQDDRNIPCQSSDPVPESSKTDSLYMDQGYHCILKPFQGLQFFHHMLLPERNREIQIWLNFFTTKEEPRWKVIFFALHRYLS